MLNFGHVNVQTAVTTICSADQLLQSGNVESEPTTCSNVWLVTLSALRQDDLLACAGVTASQQLTEPHTFKVGDGAMPAVSSASRPTATLPLPLKTTTPSAQPFPGPLTLASLLASSPRRRRGPLPPPSPRWTCHQLDFSCVQINSLAPTTAELRHGATRVAYWHRVPLVAATTSTPTEHVLFFGPVLLADGRHVCEDARNECECPEGHTAETLVLSISSLDASQDFEVTAYVHASAQNAERPQADKTNTPCLLVDPLYAAAIGLKADQLTSAAQLIRWALTRPRSAWDELAVLVRSGAIHQLLQRAAQLLEDATQVQQIAQLRSRQRAGLVPLLVPADMQTDAFSSFKHISSPSAGSYDTVQLANLAATRAHNRTLKLTIVAENKQPASFDATATPATSPSLSGSSWVSVSATVPPADSTAQSLSGPGSMQWQSTALNVGPTTCAAAATVEHYPCAPFLLPLLSDASSLQTDGPRENHIRMVTEKASGRRLLLCTELGRLLGLDESYSFLHIDKTRIQVCSFGPYLLSISLVCG